MKRPDFTGYEPCAQTDPELFYPEKSQWQQSAQAKKLCLTCDMVDACFMYGLHHEQWGVWGGTTNVERAALRKQWNIVLTDPEDDVLPIRRVTRAS